MRRINTAVRVPEYRTAATPSHIISMHCMLYPGTGYLGRTSHAAHSTVERCAVSRACRDRRRPPPRRLPHPPHPREVPPLEQPLASRAPAIF